MATKTLLTVEERMSDYFAAGCKRVWLVFPEQREVYIHGLAGVVRRRGDETLEDPELLPNFSASVSSLFEAL
jgi:Uma2 family endonuclease